MAIVSTILGIPHEELMDEMKKLKAEELNAEDGRMFAYVYTGDNSSFELQRKVHKMFTGNINMNRMAQLPEIPESCHP